MGRSTAALNGSCVVLGERQRGLGGPRLGKPPLPPEGRLLVQLVKPVESQEWSCGIYFPYTSFPVTFEKSIIRVEY